MSSSSREERRWVLFGKLKKAVSKLKVLLNFDFHVWRLAGSLLGASSSSFGPSRVISFGDRPGLTAAYEDYDPVAVAVADSDSGWYSPSPANLFSPSPSPSPRKMELRRTISRRFSMEDDVDNRAEMFIANFRRQLQIERQISLDLKYCQCQEKT